MKNNRILEDENGNQSNSRLIVDVLLFIAIIFSAIILYLSHDDVIKAASAIAIIFGAVAAPAMVFLFGQKRTESRNQRIDETNYQSYNQRYSQGAEYLNSREVDDLSEQWTKDQIDNIEPTPPNTPIL